MDLQTRSRFTLDDVRCSQCSVACGYEKGHPGTLGLPGALALTLRPLGDFEGPAARLATHDRIGCRPACLFSCLEATLNHLVFMHQRLVQEPESLHEWLAHAVAARALPGRGVAEMLSDKRYVVEVALAYWANAAVEYDEGSPTAAWPALAMANIYLGAAIGDDISLLRGQGGLVRSKTHFDPVRVKGLELLEVMRAEGEGRFHSKKTAIAELALRFAALPAKDRKFLLVAKPAELISEWAQPANHANHPDNEALHQHLSALVERGIRRGRPPGSGLKGPSN